MDEAEDMGEHTMQTRKRRRDYKSLEDGKEAENELHAQKISVNLKEKRPEKHHIISINTNILKSMDDGNNKHQKGHESPTHSNHKTNGRWTSEEHKKFIEALKKYGKQWKKVEDYIQTRSGAQIRSHAQKYFLKIQKEYPDQDSFEVFQTKTPEFLETTIFMKKKGDSDDMASFDSISRNDHPTTPKKQELNEIKKDPSIEFSQSVEKLLAKKRINKMIEKSEQSLSDNHQNDLRAIRLFLDHIKSKIAPVHNNFNATPIITTEEVECNKILNEYAKYRKQICDLINQNPQIQSISNHIPQNELQIQNGDNDFDMFKKVCDEFIKMKHNYDIVKNAQFSFSKIAQENSSLDNLIQASFNPIFNARTRVDSLQNIRDEKFGRKRAMTIDGPVRDKYVPLKTSNKSAFSSYKHEIKTTEAQRQSKDTEEELKDNDLKIELKLSKKRTYAEMKKNFHMQSSQLLIFPHESFSGRKRAKSF